MGKDMEIIEDRGSWEYLHEVNERRHRRRRARDRPRHQRRGLGRDPLPELQGPLEENVPTRDRNRVGARTVREPVAESAGGGTSHPRFLLGRQHPRGMKP